MGRSQLVSISIAEKTLSIQPNGIVKAEKHGKLGSPLFLLVITETDEKKVYKIPVNAGEDWKTGEIVYYFSNTGREVFLDTLAHVIEASVKQLYPEYKLAGREVRENEVRIDFYTNEKPFTKEQVEKIKQTALEIIKEAKIEVISTDKKEVLKTLEEDNEKYLAHLAKETRKPVLLKIKDVLTLCDTPIHLPDLSLIKIIEITNVSMTHWLGEEEGDKLYSLHVIGFPSEHDKKIYEKRLEEVKKRDHVILGKEMDVFLTNPVVGAGIILWPPNGAMIKRVLEEYIVKLHLKNDYQLVATPHIATTELFSISGHLAHYKQNMFLFEIDKRPHAIKPMNCPFHIMILKRRKWSYKDLPIRYFEMGNVYRYERAGTLHGLTRVRGFVIDDAHVFVREDQIEEEITKIIQLINEIYTTMGLKDYKFSLSLRDPQDTENFMGSPEIWEHAETALENALKKLGVDYTKEIGEAAFYGPKIDVVFTDALGREWQCATIQLDFNLPERFDLTYIDEDNKEKRMVIIHRALLGSIERFIGILMEQFAGRLPLWLAPIQVAVLPVEESNNTQIKAAEELQKELKSQYIRTILLKEGRLNNRLRQARTLRIPLIVVLGEKELSTGTITATYITYGEDEERRFKPKQEKMSFKDKNEFINWMKQTIRKQTNNILG